MALPISMNSLQGADQRLGWLACACLQPLRWLRAWRSRRAVPAQAQRVLLVKFWGIGSLQLLTPAIRAVREEHPGARLTLLTLAENEAFVQGLGLVDQVMTLNVRTGWVGVGQRILGLFWRVRRGRYDAVYDFEFFTRFSAVLSFASGAALRVGFHSPSVWRGRLHTREVPFNRYWHVARNFRALAVDDAGFEVGDDELRPFQTQPDHRRSVSRFLADQPPERAVVVLNPNAGALSLERRWPAERFAALAQALVREDQVVVVLVGAPSERPYCEEILESIHAELDGPERARAVSAAGQLDLGGLCALLQRADAVVSNDSGPMHLASALGRPTLGLFGPETPHMYRPLGPRAEYLWDPPICSPCINVHDNKRTNCIHGRPECLMNLELETVLARTRRLLSQKVQEQS